MLQLLRAMAFVGTGCCAVLRLSPVHERDSIADQGLVGPMTRGSVIACLMMMVRLSRVAIFSKGSWITKPAPKVHRPVKAIETGSTHVAGVFGSD